MRSPDPPGRSPKAILRRWSFSALLKVAVEPVESGLTAWVRMLLSCSLSTFALLIIAVCFSPGPEQAAGAEQTPLVFLGDKDYPPVAYLEDGIAKGMDVDLAKALARPMKRESRSGDRKYPKVSHTVNSENRHLFRLVWKLWNLRD